MDNNQHLPQRADNTAQSVSSVLAASLPVSPTMATTFHLNHSTYPPANTIAFWNANSMREHYDSIRMLLHPSTANRPRVLALAETKLNPSSIDNLPTIQHYTQLHRPHSNMSGGLALLVHDSVAVRELDNSYPHPILSTANQSAATIAANAADPSNAFWVELRFPGMQSAMLLAVIYIQPGASTAAIERLTDNIDMVCNNTTLPVLLLGDFNLRHRQWCSTAPIPPTAAAHYFSDYLCDSNMMVLNDGSHTNIGGPAVSDPANRTLTTIDLAITPSAFSHTYSFISSDGYGLISNAHTHIPITVQVQQQPAVIDQQLALHRTKPLWRVSSNTPAEQWLVFRDGLSLLLLDSFPFDVISRATAQPQQHDKDIMAMHQHSIEEWNDTLVHCIHLAADGAFGTRTNNSSFNHWFTQPEVRASYRGMLSAHQQWQQLHTADTQQRWKDAQHRWDVIKADAKLQCWRDFAAGLQQDEHTQQVRWSVFHQSLHKPYASLSSFPNHVDGSLPASKAQSLTNLAHAYVAASIPSAPLPQHIQQQVDDELAANPTSHMDASDAWQFTAADVKQQCTRQHTTTASGADGVEALFLKRGGEQLYRAIALLYSYSWQHSVIPQAWRDANVCSIYKGAGPKHAATSYRPISVTSMLVRTMEHIIHHQLTDRLEATSYFSADQFGFRHHRSTLDAIHCLLAKLKRGLRHGAGILPVIYLDLRKAFDRVCIPRLLHILSTRVGIRGRLWGWLRSFLTNRRIRACDRSDAGEWCSISYGVPQGAVLSPLLFLCYIHEMVQQLCDTPFRSPTNPHIRLQLNQCIHIWLFADDIALMPNYNAFHTTDGSVHSDWALALQQSLDALSTWAGDNCMEFNHTKSNIVYHATDIRWQQQRTAFHTQLQPCVSGAVLQPADHYTYLGLTISNDMTWTAQFDRMLVRVRSDAHLVSRLIQSDNRPPYFTAIHALCKLYIRSRCTYAMQLWQPTDKQMRQLEYQMIRPVMHLLRLPHGTCCFF